MTSAILRQARQTARRQAARHQTDAYVRAELEKHGGQIPLANIEPVKKVGTLFYFPRSEPIKDGQVLFVTKMGPVEVKCKFTVKEMTVHGKLEL